MPTEPENTPADIDLMSGFPTMQLSFILSQMAPLSHIQSESVQRASNESRKLVEAQFRYMDTTRIARIGTSLEECAVPPFAKRSTIKGDARDLTTYEINIEAGESQWMLVALEKKASYMENADAEKAKFIIEEDQTETGYVRLRLRKPEQTKDCKKQLDEKCYISSVDIAEKFRKMMNMFQQNAQCFGDDRHLPDTIEGEENATSRAIDDTCNPKKTAVLVYAQRQVTGEAKMSDQVPVEMSLQSKEAGEDRIGDQAPPDAGMQDQAAGDAKMRDQTSADVDMQYQTAEEAKKRNQTSTDFDTQSQQAADTKMADQEANDVEIIVQDAKHEAFQKKAGVNQNDPTKTAKNKHSDTQLSDVSAVDQTDKEMNETLNSDIEGMRKSEVDMLRIETNVSIAFPCAMWPRIASGWRKRLRPSGWPSAEMMDRFMSKGCLMIPRAYSGSEHQDIEWQIALDTDELTKTLSDTQKQCLVLLKILRYHCFDTPKILTPEHMLFLLLWVCEKIPGDDWTVPKLSVNFNICLDMLFRFIADRYMPHYFYECNMLKGISADHLDELAKRVSLARHEPAQQFYTFSKQYLTSYFPTRCDMQDLLQVFEHGKFKYTEAECVRIQIQCLQALADELVKDRRYERVVAIHREYEEIAPPSMADAFPEKVDDYLSDRALDATTLDDSMSISEFITKHFPLSTSLCSHYSNLAWIYHRKYAVSTDETEQKELRGKVYWAFEHALKEDEEEDVSPASKIEFCNFLLQVKGYKRAIHILEQVVTEIKDIDKEIYRRSEKKTVHSELQPWIEQMNELEVWSLNYCQYLLVKCLIENEQQWEAIQILKEMRYDLKEAQSSPSTAGPHLWTSYLLLGYAAKSLGKLNLAAETFRQLNEKIQPSPLARAEYEECFKLCADVGEKDDLSEDEDKTEEDDYRDNTSTETNDVLGWILDNALKNQTQEETEQLRMSAEAKVKEMQFSDALKDFEELCAKRNSVEEAQQTPEFLMFSMMSSVDVNLAVEILKCLIETFPESSNLYIYRSNMVCMYHMLFCQATDESEKEELRCLAKQGFERARNDKAASTLTSCHYANFLYSTGECEAALELAEATITHQMAKSPQEWCERTISYGQQQIKAVDENLAREIEYARSIEAAPLIYSFYIAINCCLKLEKSDDARDLVMKMKESCERLVSANSVTLQSKSSAQLLLGHAAREAQDFSTGEDAFKWVCENDTRQESGAKSDRAEENMLLCKALAVSLEPHGSDG